MRRSTLKARLDSERARRMSAERDVRECVQVTDGLRARLEEAWRRENDGSTLADLRREVSALRAAHLFVLNQNAALTLELEARKQA